MKNYLFETALLLVILGAIAVVPAGAKTNKVAIDTPHEISSITAYAQTRIKDGTATAGGTVLPGNRSLHLLVNTFICLGR